ncbi:SGNH/GDSL hydrolase family protein [Lactobacillus sp. CC-MHH1034]|uniref:SGNH/GDSL hydrolase family protein n=1 Tax=Agrilactobacillus fermenti TaxID=2586909 RepID=UPI001E3F94E8|nr:SGNH/GDSL hydrolase family protein [Agrilactobacillus fermenti]MCD2256047.1 SGNH/GDSL hydrolase family protein [Agrilactobacillus fermenti]
MTEKSNNPLNGKVLYAFGTSIVNGHLANTSFVDDIGQANQMTYRKFCVNGAAARTTDTNNIVTQIENAPTKVPDLIVFDAVDNDAYAQVVDDPQIMGQITYDDALDSKTYCGAVETICRLLETKYQGAKLLYIATHKTPARDLRVQNVMQATALKIMRKWSIAVADLYTAGNFNAFLEQYQHDYSYDTVDHNGSNHAVGGTGTHPNAAGYRLFYDPIITQKLKTLVTV